MSGLNYSRRYSGATSRAGGDREGWSWQMTEHKARIEEIEEREANRPPITMYEVTASAEERRAGAFIPAWEETGD